MYHHQEYLFRLATDIHKSSEVRGRVSSHAARAVDRRVSHAAKEALEFLRARDDFWQQVK